MKRAKAKPDSPAKILERQVTQQVKDFLSYRGWRSIRNQRTVIPGSFQSGEPGQADFLFVHYVEAGRAQRPGVALCLWIEVKGPKDARKCRCVPGEAKKCGFCQQAHWQARERTRGGIVWVIDDFNRLVSLYDLNFGWLHSGDTGRGQLDLLAGLSDLPL